MFNNLNIQVSAPDYLVGTSFADYLKIAATSFPDMWALLDHDAIIGHQTHEYIQEMNAASWEFEDVTTGGRGVAYNVAQQTINNRQLGMVALLKCFSPTFSEMPDSDIRILDVLGGDGTIARFVENLTGPKPTIYTADLSRYMVDACLKQNRPCIRQSATRSLFQDNVLDGVLIAYGSHHLSLHDRQIAANEAHRTLKPGGRLVLHDFETGEETAKWFEEVVHPYSRTGHPHPHFSRQEMWQIFGEAGFRDVRILDLNDPFTLPGATADEAKNNALMHMYHMYDLVKIANVETDIASRVETCVRDTLGHIEVHNNGQGFIATIPRRALIAVGTKS
jgi:SAM-dependent methyltransferase